jgi:hypothetical protein
MALVKPFGLLCYSQTGLVCLELQKEKQPTPKTPSDLRWFTKCAENANMPSPQH